MLIGSFRLVARFRRPILVVELILVAAYFAVVPRHSSAAGWLLFPVAFATAAGCVALAVLASWRYRPAVLVADPARPAFDTVVSPLQLFVVTAFLAFELNSTDQLARSIHERDVLWLLDAALLALIPALMIVLLTTAWRALGVRLRPDGLLDRQVLGSLFVPWEAFDPSTPPAPGRRSADMVFTFQRPDLVRRRGIILFGRRTIRVQNIDHAFLAAIINHYVRHPEHRAAIGSETELHRLTSSALLTR